MPGCAIWLRCLRNGLFRRVGLEQVDFSAFDFAVHVCQLGDDGRDVFERVGDGLLVTLALDASSVSFMPGLPTTARRRGNSGSSFA